MWAVTAWIQPRGSSPAQGRTGSGVGRCGDREEAVVAAADAVGRKRRARDVTSEALELPGILRGERFSGKNGEPAWYQKILHDENYFCRLAGKCNWCQTASDRKAHWTGNYCGFENLLPSSTAAYHSLSSSSVRNRLFSSVTSRPVFW